MATNVRATVHVIIRHKSLRSDAAATQKGAGWTPSIITILHMSSQKKGEYPAKQPRIYISFQSRFTSLPMQQAFLSLFQQNFKYESPCCSPVITRTVSFSDQYIPILFGTQGNIFLVRQKNLPNLSARKTILGLSSLQCHTNGHNRCKHGSTQKKKKSLRFYSSFAIVLLAPMTS